MAKGTIKKLLPDRRYGFINTEEGKDLFFHEDKLEGVAWSALKVGQDVEYELGKHRGGRPEAVSVRLPRPQTEYGPHQGAL